MSVFLNFFGDGIFKEIGVGKDQFFVANANEIQSVDKLVKTQILSDPQPDGDRSALLLPKTARYQKF